MKARLLIPLLLALAGCARPERATDLAPSADVGRTLHVDHVRVQYAAAFAPGGADLPLAEATQLESFLDQSGLRPNDRIFIASPSGDPLAATRIGRVVALLSQRGVGAEQVAPPPDGVEPNHLLLLVDRYVVAAPACPDWSDSPATPHDNTPNSNFGCATLSNLAQMVDNPRDLIMGRTLAPADGDPALAAVARFRADKVKPFVSQNSGPAPATAPPEGGMAAGGSGVSGGTTGQ